MKNSQFWGRKSAEILSFVISSSIILGIIGFLAFDHFKSKDSPFLEMKVTIFKDKVHQVGENYILPVKIENLGNRTATKATFSVEILVEGSEEKSQIDLDYLARHSSKTFYLAHRKNLSHLTISIKLESYQL